MLLERKKEVVEERMEFNTNQQKGKQSETAVFYKANLRSMVFIFNRPVPKSKNQNDLVIDLFLKV